MPDNFKTKTQLKKMGRRRRPKQEPVAIFKGYYGNYPLYDVKDSLPSRKPTEAQLAALAAGREKRDRERTCAYCGVQSQQRLEERRCSHCLSRHLAIAEARQLLQRHRLIAFDTETTGLGGRDEIISLAVVDGKTGQVLYSSHFCPTVEIHPEASAIHGFTNQSLAQAPRFASEFPKFRRFFSHAITTVVAYNYDFDERLLAQTANRYGLRMPKMRRNACIMKLFAQYYGAWSQYHRSYTWKKLSVATDVLDIELDNPHAATADAVAAVRVLHEMARKSIPEDSSS